MARTSEPYTVARRAILEGRLDLKEQAMPFVINASDDIQNEDARDRVASFASELLAEIEAVVLPGVSTAHEIAWVARKKGGGRNFALVVPSSVLFESGEETASDGSLVHASGEFSALSAPSEGVGLQFARSPFAFGVSYVRRGDVLRLSAWVGTGDPDQVFWPAWPPRGTEFCLDRYVREIKKQAKALDEALRRCAQLGCAVEPSHNGVLDEMVTLIKGGHDRSFLLGVQLLRAELKVESKSPLEVRVEGLRPRIEAARPLIEFGKDTARSLDPGSPSSSD